AARNRPARLVAAVVAAVAVAVAVLALVAPAAPVVVVAVPVAVAVATAVVVPAIAVVVVAANVRPAVEQVEHHRAERRVGLAVPEVVVDPDVERLRQDRVRPAIGARRP